MEEYEGFEEFKQKVDEGEIVPGDEIFVRGSYIKEQYTFTGIEEQKKSLIYRLISRTGSSYNARKKLNNRDWEIPYP